jgi:hypothetical protein
MKYSSHLQRDREPQKLKQEDAAHKPNRAMSLKRQKREGSRLELAVQLLAEIFLRQVHWKRTNRQQ